MTKEQHLQRLRDDPLYVILGEALSCGRTNVQTAADVLAAGVRIIQYREKHKTWREKYAEAKEIRRLCRKYDATFIMNDAVDLAVACEADGIHVGQDDAPVSFVHRRIDAYGGRNDGSRTGRCGLCRLGPVLSDAIQTGRPCAGYAEGAAVCPAIIDSRGCHRRHRKSEYRGLVCRGIPFFCHDQRSCRTGANRGCRTGVATGSSC